MSGISGIFHLDGGPVEASMLRRMTNALAHWGPDAAGLWRKGSVGLAHRMLRTTPESMQKQQPCVSASGAVVVVADARMDNRESLIEQLSLGKQSRRAISDSELIAALYEEWGSGCAERLLGAFAFAVWDLRQRELFCTLDHLGVKPLYYYHAPGRLFGFTSEIKALWEVDGVPSNINDLRVAQHLLIPVEEDPSRTFYEHIHRLSPAHQIRVGVSTFNVRRSEKGL